MELALHDVIAGLIGLGMVVKGAVDYATNKKQTSSPACECKYDTHCFDKVLLEFTRLNLKLDHLIEVFHDKR